MNCLLVMKIKWSLDINTGAVERSEAARARRLAGATVVGPVTARADQVWHAETGPPDQIWRRTNYYVTGTVYYTVLLYYIYQYKITFLGRLSCVNASTSQTMYMFFWGG